MSYLVCSLDFLSEKSLEEIAEIISSKLIAGIPFVGRDEFIYDEVPAVYARDDVLGLRIILQGFGGKEGYHLEMHPSNYPFENLSEGQMEEPNVDITEYVAFLLKDVEGLNIQKE